MQFCVLKPAHIYFACLGVLIEPLFVEQQYVQTCISMMYFYCSCNKKEHTLARKYEFYVVVARATEERVDLNKSGH